MVPAAGERDGAEHALGSPTYTMPAHTPDTPIPHPTPSTCVYHAHRTLLNCLLPAMGVAWPGGTLLLVLPCSRACMLAWRAGCCWRHHRRALVSRPTWGALRPAAGMTPDTSTTTQQHIQQGVISHDCSVVLGCGSHHGSKCCLAVCEPIDVTNTRGVCGSHSGTGLQPWPVPAPAPCN